MATLQQPHTDETPALAHLKSLALKIAERWRGTWRNAVVSGIAAALAWTLAQRLFGHPQPLFALITAMVCLAPGLPSYHVQAMGVLLGVATGVIVGELALFLPDAFPLLRIAVTACVAILVAVSYGFPPVVPIQAGVSSVLVLTFGPVTAGTARLLDVALGAAIGLLFSQLLLPSNPLRAIERASRDLLTKLASGFGTYATALREHDCDKAGAALHAVSSAHDSVTALDDGIEAARNAPALPAHSRLTVYETKEIAACRDGHAIRLLASTLLFASDVADTLTTDKAPVPDRLCRRVQALADTCASMANGDTASTRFTRDDLDSPDAMPPPWRATTEHLQRVEEALAAFGTELPPSRTARVQ
jgi:uncharacterized membrane protein YccC